MRNKMKVSRARTFVKKLRASISSGSKDEALKILPQVQSILAKLSKTNTLKKSVVSRTTSRLAAQIAQMGN